MFGLRSRVLALVLALCAVMAAIAAFLAHERRQDNLAHAFERIKAISELIAAEQRSNVAYADQLLESLATTGDVGSLAREADCSPRLSLQLKRHERFANIGVFSATGDLLCAAVPGRGIVNVADRAYFQKASAASGLVIGEAVLDRASEKFLLPVLRVIRDREGRFVGALLAGLDLAWVSGHLSSANLPPAATLGLIDAKGIVIARSPDSEGAVGKNYSATPFFRTLTAQQGHGAAESVGFDDVPRIYSFVPFAQTTGGEITLWVGLSRQSVVGAVNAQFAWTLAGIVLLTSLVSVVAWVGGDRLLLRPVTAIRRFARRIGEGDAAARTGLAHDADEMGQLARVLDGMAESLASTDHLMRTNRALRVLSAVNQALVHASGEAALLESMCRAVGEAGKFRMAWVGYGDNNAEKTVRVVSHWEAPPDYLAGLKVSWGDNERGRGPSGTAIRTGKPAVMRYPLTDPAYAPWRDAAQRHGYASSIALPIAVDGGTIGSLNLYAKERDAFADEEVELLMQAAGELSFGIATQRAALEHERAQSLAGQADARFRTVARVSPVGIGYTDADGKCLYVNERWCELAGIPAEQAAGRSWMSAVHPDDRERIELAWQACVRDERVFEAEYRFRRPDGKTAWLFGRAAPVFSQDAAITGWAGAITDVSVLREREAALAHVERTARIGSWELDVPTGRLQCSDELLRIVGRTREQFDGTLASAIAWTHPEDKERLQAAVHATLFEGHRYSIDHRITRPDGTVRYVHAEDEMQTDTSGKPVRMLGFFQDITERKLAEAAEAQRLQRLSAQAIALGEAVAAPALGEGDVESFAREVTERAARAAECERANVWLFNADESELRCIDGYEATPRRHSSGAVLREAEFRAEFEVLKRVPYVNADNPLTDPRTAGYVESYIKPLGISSMLDVVIRFAGRHLGLLCLEHVGKAHHWVNDEISFARQLADKIALAIVNRDRLAALRRIGALMQHGSDLVAVVDRKGIVRYASPSLRHIAGYEPDEALGKPFMSWFHPDDLAVAGEGLAALLATPGATRASEYRFRHKDGGWRILSSIGRSALDDPAVDGIVVNARDVTQQKAAEQRVRESDERLRSIFDKANDVIFTISEDGTFLSLSPAIEQITGWKVEEWLGRPFLPMVHEEEREHAEELLRATLGDGQSRQFEMRIGKKDGGYWNGEFNIGPLELGAGKVLFGIGRDITERKRADERIRRLNRMYAVLSGINGAIVRTRAPHELFQEASRIAVEAGEFVMAWGGRVERDGHLVRPEGWAGDDVRGFLDVALLAKLATLPGGNGLVGRAGVDKEPMVSNDVPNDPQLLMRKELQDRGIRSVAVLPLLQDDEAVGMLAFYAAEPHVFDDDEMRLLVELASNVAFALDYMSKAEKVNYLAYYDVLTGLPNRALALDRLGQQLTRAASAKEGVALVLLDVQRFRNVNDTLGRHMGDEALKELGSRLAATLGEEGSVAHIGADLFAFIVAPVHAASEALLEAQKALGAGFDQPVTVGGQELRLAGRTGVALFPGDALDAESLYRCAEAALAKAKQEGEQSVFYSPEMNARVAERLGLESRLRTAIEQEQFELHYQPKWDSRTGAMEGLEALIRWNDPERGLVPPAAFIALLEETGLILPVGEWALRRAVRQCREWQDAGLPLRRVAVNVSALQLRQKDFVDVVRGALDAFPGVSCLDLEITESLVMKDVQGNIAKLRTLRDLGVQTAIDDFGTGYSSLAYIAKLPIDVLKIDRSFVVAMPNSAVDMGIVSSIIALAHRLDLKVVAEGVDSEEQAKLLRLLKCDQMQGFLFSKPLPAAGIAALLAPGGAPPDHDLGDRRFA